MAKFGVPKTTLSLRELFEKYSDLVPDVDQELEDLQITPLLDAPLVPDGIEGSIDFLENGDPADPEDITLVGDEVTGKLFTYYSAWTNYLQSRMTRMECLMLAATKCVDVIKAALTEHYLSEGVPTTRVKNKVIIDPRYIEADEAYTRAKMTHIQLKAAYERMRRVINLISREQSRRSDEIDREGSNPDGRGGAPFTTRADLRKRGIG